MRTLRLFFWFIWFIFLFYFVISSESEEKEEEEEEFIPFSSATANATTESEVIDEILMDESVSLSLSCEKSLGSSEEALKAFVMKSLDISAEETLADLERPSCRAFFDRNGGHLSKEQMVQLMSTERGQRILEQGEVLEFFSDYSEFTLQDFNRFPTLQVGKIRNLSSIPADVLLALVKGRGYSNAGRLERIPEALGERVFEHESWLLDPEIWQIFTLEGLVQLQSVSFVEKFAKFLADCSKFDKLIFKIDDQQVEEGDGEEQKQEQQLEQEQESIEQRTPFLRGRSSSDLSVRSASTLPATIFTSAKVCKAIIKHSNLLARWAVQCEELMLYLIEVNDNERQVLSVIEAVKNLIKSRNWLGEQVKSRCNGATGISEKEHLQLTNLKTILESPMAWRLKEALRILGKRSSSSSSAAAVVDNLEENATSMTRNLIKRLKHYPAVMRFYVAGNPPENDQLLTHFFLVNEISDLDTIFEGETVDLNAANEKLVLSIAIRRILLLLLSPSIESSNVIQDALNYVFSTRSSNLLATSDSNEIVRWFRQARDLQAIPVLDRLIRSFGHEFDVAREIQSMLNNEAVRIKLFTEAQSAFVRLLAALANGLGEYLVDGSPLTLRLPYLDPANALLKSKVAPLPVHSSRRPHSEKELAEHANQVKQVREHNSAIARALNRSLRFLISVFIDPNTLGLSPNFSSFIQPNFSIKFYDNLGVDAGGLRRTWLSALLRIFGDAQRMLFPLHMELGGRIPAALLDPEIMGYLGALHGKALQIGVKPDWFFSRRYSHSLLFARTLPEPEDLVQIVQELYAGIFESFNLIMQMESEEASVEYFNSSEFPTIEGLTTNENENENENENMIVTEAETGMGTGTIVNNADTGAVNNDANVHMTTTNTNNINDSDDDSVITTTQEAQEVTSTPTSPTITTVNNANPPNSPPRHSFSRMLVFDVRYLAQRSIYKGPRQTVASLQEIAQYRSALIDLFAANLLQGVQAYHRTFKVFFDSRFRDQMEAEFLHDLLEPPQVTIEDILTRVHFHRSCDNINLIDDETEDNPDSDDSDESFEVKRARLVPGKISNITARTALTRILLTSFTSPETINSLLSFSTGCPQIPPAGLDALRLSVHCYASNAPATRLSKSHTCSNLIDFFVSTGYKETKEAFKESAISSSGFGFD